MYHTGGEEAKRREGEEYIWCRNCLQAQRAGTCENIGGVVFNSVDNIIEFGGDPSNAIGPRPNGVGCDLCSFPSKGLLSGGHHVKECQ